MKKELLLQEIEVIYNKKVKNSELEQITTSTKSFEIIKKICLEQNLKVGYKEYFGVIFMNRSNKVIGYSINGVGSSSSVTVNTKEIMSIALNTNIDAMIIWHNHPSGSLTVSTPDKELTTKINKACEIFNINLLDHIIINDEDEYYSFTDNSIL